MSSEKTIVNKLDGKNFDEWFLFVKNFLISKKLFRYSEVDVVAEGTEILNQSIINLHEIQNQAHQDGNEANHDLHNNINELQNLINQQREAVEKAIANDATVNTIIITSMLLSKDKLSINLVTAEDFDNNITMWTYDSGSSEHITNDKSLLKNYTEQIITMKCANDTECHFEGFGTYKGIINGHEITLNKVLFSKSVK